MADYLVNYQINVDSRPALDSIKQFQTATESLRGLASTFEYVTKEIGAVNRALISIGKNTPTLTIHTSEAKRKIKEVADLLVSLKTAANITLNLQSAPAKSGGKATTATGSISALKSSITGTQKAIALLNNEVITPKASTTDAQTKLDKLLTTLQSIHSLRRVSITGTTPAARSGGGTVTRTAAASSSAGHSKLLFPTTRQVLGPTYANTGTNMMGEMIKGMGVAYGLSMVSSGIGSVFKDATAYNNITQTTKNILGAHDKSIDFEKNFDEMNALMRQVGVETKFTAPQVAEAGKFLAMAGYNVGDIKRSVRPITDIALIGDTELGETADVMTNIMTSYKMPAQQVGRAADILTMTFTKTNTTLMDLAESFKYAGTMAYQSGLSFEASSAAIGVLGDAGIKGSQAGTTLRMMLMNMMNPTKKQKEAWEAIGIKVDDGHGNMRNFVDIISDLSKVREKTTAYGFQKIMNRMFRVTAVPGALSLVNNAQKLSDVNAANSQSYGLSSELALAKQNTIQGLWYQVTSAFTETGMQNFGKMQGSVKAFLQDLIALMKSDSFASTLRDGMNIFLQLIRGLSEVFQQFMSLWNNLIPNAVKENIVTFAKLQMKLSMLAGFSQMIMSTWLMIRGIIRGEWLFKTFSLITGAWKLAKSLRATYLLLRSFQIGRFAALLAAPSLLIGATETAKVASEGLGSALKNVGVLGLAFHPVTLGLLAITTALAGAVYYFYNLNSVGKQTLSINQNLAESFRKFGITKNLMSDPDAIAIGNMRIYNSELLTQNQRLAEGARLFNEYYKAKHSEPKAEKDETSFLKTPEGKDLATQWKYINYMFSDNSGKFYPLWKELKGRAAKHPDTGKLMYNVGDYWFGSGKLNKKGYPDFTDDEAKDFALYAFGANYDSKKLLKVEKDLFSQITGASSAKNAVDILNKISQSVTPQKLHSPEYSRSYLDQVSPADIYRVPQIWAGFEPMLNTATNGWRGFISLMESMDAGKHIPLKDIQAQLESRVSGKIFNTKHLFGTKDWTSYAKDMIANPGKHGFDSEQVAVESIVTSFKAFTELYNNLADKYKPYFAPFLNRTTWESVLPSPGKLPIGGVTPGDKAGDKMTADGKLFTWGKVKNSHFSWWLDKTGKLFAPQNASNALISMVDHSNTGSDNPLDKLEENDDYRSRYGTAATPKQVIVRIEKLMNVENVDLGDERKKAAVDELQQTLASVLTQVVSDFAHNSVL